MSVDVYIYKLGFLDKWLMDKKVSVCVCLMRIIMLLDGSTNSFVREEFQSRHIATQNKEP